MVQRQYVFRVAFHQFIIGTLALLHGRTSGIARIKVPEHQRLIALLGDFADEIVVISIRLLNSKLKMNIPQPRVINTHRTHPGSGDAKDPLQCLLNAPHFIVDCPKLSAVCGELDATKNTYYCQTTTLSDPCAPKCDWQQDAQQRRRASVN